MDILKIDSRKPDRNIIKRAITVLQNGGLVVYPTDTAYGLGCNALNKDAIRKLYNIKDRGFSKPTHVVVRNWEMIKKITFPNVYAKILYKKFLPGPLTLILPKKKIVPDMLTAGLSTLGVRIPNYSVTQKMSSLLPFPYTTPSANRAGGKTPYSIDKVKQELDIEKVDLIIDAGDLAKTLPSTLIDLSIPTPTVLRDGPIKETQVRKALKI